MVEPFTIAANVTGQVNRPRKQDVALIYGAGDGTDDHCAGAEGFIGRKRSPVVDRIEERLLDGEQSGADWTLNNGQHSLAKISLQQKALKPTLIVDAACHRYRKRRFYLHRLRRIV